MVKQEKEGGFISLLLLSVKTSELSAKGENGEFHQDFIISSPSFLIKVCFFHELDAFSFSPTMFYEL